MPTTVYFATNRDITGTDRSPKIGKHFHAKNPAYLRFGKAVVAEDRGRHRFQSAELAPEKIPDRGDAAPGAKLGSEAIFDELRHAMKDGNADLLVYIHGFNCSFADAVEHCAQLQASYAADRPMLGFTFSWPSDGEMVPRLSYLSDRDDAARSGPAIARAFLRLIDYLCKVDRGDYCLRNIHVVAHSMGNYALRHTLQALIAREQGRLPRVFRNIFLMAPDEDDDAFEHDYKLKRLAELAARVHVYHSVDDRALHVSDITKGNPERLGSSGPRMLSNLPLKIVIVDCRSVDDADGDTAHHSYYRLRREVVEDVRQVVRGIASEEVANRRYLEHKRAFRIMRMMG